MKRGATPILVLYGATGTGKTRTSIAIAEHVGGEVVGADSVQVYRGFDVGSAKPTREEMGGVPHHLIDILEPDEEVDAQRYADLADDAIEAIWGRGRVPIVVGGTGLWLRALLRGLAPLPAVDPEIRLKWEGRVAAWSAEERIRHLASVDPISAGRLHGNDQLRIVRAFEVHEQLGRPLGEVQAEHAMGSPRYDALIYHLVLPKPEHEAALNARTESMLAAGWLEEVRALIERWGTGIRPLRSVGYREVLDHLTRAIPWDITRATIQRSTRLYARRQRTWANSMQGVHATLTGAEMMKPAFMWDIMRKLRSSGPVSPDSANTEEL